MIQTSRIPWKAHFHEQLDRIIVHEDSQLAQALDLHGHSTSAWLPARGLLEDFIRKEAAVNMHPVSEDKGADLSEQQAHPCLLTHTRPHHMQLDCTRLALQLSTDVQ